MTEITDLTAAMNTLVNQLRQSDSMGAGSGSRSRYDLDSVGKTLDTFTADQQSNQQKTNAMLKQLNSGITGTLTSQKAQIGKLTDNLKVHAAATNKVFSDAMDNLKHENLEKVPEVFNEFLKGSDVSTTFKNTLSKVSTYADLITAQKDNELRAIKLQEYEELKNRLDVLRQNNEMDDEVTNAMFNVTEELNKLDISTDDLREKFDDLKKDTVKVSEVFERTGHRASGGGLNEFLGKAGKTITVVGGAVLALGNAVKDTAQSAAKFGTQVEYLDATLVGMSSEELNQLQADMRQSINASGMSFDQFNEAIKEGQSEMWGYTGSLRDAARLNAEAFDQSRFLQVKNSEEFTKDQRRVFKNLNNTISMTAENFMEMNKQLLNSQEVRTQLFKLSKEERSAHFKDLQNTYAKLTTDGLMHEQAMRVISTLEELGGKGPKDRIKEAAKMQATMGAIGMGAEGAEMADLMRGGLRTEKDKSRFAELSKLANQEVSNRMGGGLQSEMVMTQLLESTGMGKYLGPESPLADLVLQQGKAFDETTNNSRESVTGLKNIHKSMSGSFTMLEQINTTLKHPLTIVGMAGAAASLAKIATFLTGGGLLGGLAGIMSGGGAGAAGAAGGAGKGLGTSVSKAGGLGVLAAGAVGWQIGQMAGDALVENMKKRGTWEENSNDIGIFLDRLQFWDDEKQARADMMEKRIVDQQKAKDKKDKELYDEQVKLIQLKKEEQKRERDSDPVVKAQKKAMEEHYKRMEKLIQEQTEATQAQAQAAANTAKDMNTAARLAKKPPGN